MVKLPAGMTTVDPAAGGTVPVTGAVTAQLTVNPSTTVKDASGKDVAGEINITATPVNDIVTGQAESTTGLAVLQFLPEGYRFSPALNLAVQNPMTNHYFGNTFLQYYDAGTGMWNTMSQPVTFANGAYNTTIDHFSIYKIGFSNGRSEVSSESRSIDVIDGVIDNTGKLEPVPVIFAKVQRLTGLRLYDSDRRCASGRRHHERRGRTDRRDTEGDQGLQPRRGRCRSDDYGRVGNSCEYFGSGQHEADDDRPAGSDDRGLYVQHHEHLRLFVQRGCQYARPANSVSVTTDFTPGDTHTVPGGDGTGGGGSN